MDGWRRRILDPNEVLRCCPIPSANSNGRIFGVVGWGELGRGAARIAEASHAVIIAIGRGQSPLPDRVDLDELLATADIVSLHCPLNDSTRGLMGSGNSR